MDFLDPKKERRNQLTLLIGYGFVALAIGIATLVLLYQSYGYGVDGKGHVTQNGLLFVSSQPSGAGIYLNSKRYKSDTNARVTVASNTYTLAVAKDGYRTWQRQVVVDGGDVQHFDYPFLFPTTLKTGTVASQTVAPSIATQSLDKRWLLLGQADSPGVFTQYDLKNPAKPVATTVALPADVFTPGEGAQTWTQVEWASDGQHVLLLHTYVIAGVTTKEYVLVNRDTPASSVNLTKTLNLTQTQTVNLFNNRTQQLYVYNSADQTLARMNASDASVVSKIEHVLAFKSYADNKILYVSDQTLAGKVVAGQVSVVLQDGEKASTLRTLPSGADSYALNLAQYSGDWYVAVAASNDTATYVYKNPQGQTLTAGRLYPDPWRRLPVAASYLAFSDNTQFLFAENGTNFVTYDLENIIQYHYKVHDALDDPQVHATWMDGNRLEYVTGGKLEVFDYDYRNIQTLVAANSVYPAFFAPDFSYLYALKNSTTGTVTKSVLSDTPLIVK
jgi:hypothetical protein